MRPRPLRRWMRGELMESREMCGWRWFLSLLLLGAALHAIERLHDGFRNDDHFRKMFLP